MQLPEFKPQDFDEAIDFGIQLFKAGEYQRAIAMYELAKKLPGEIKDFERMKQSEMSPLLGWQASPQGWQEKRYTSEKQKLVAQYNIACCFSTIGDTAKAMELLEDYSAKMDDPITKINEMVVDPDLVAIRDDLMVLRKSYKKIEKGQQMVLNRVPQMMGNLLKNEGLMKFLVGKKGR
mmetsp:Transcript_44986/g.74881  ORF Transcript_44986/g.74881 Transcript_44986/m.74881 type:complete len:178 (-) Transcript_44986:148-681(-)